MLDKRQDANCLLDSCRLLKWIGGEVVLTRLVAFVTIVADVTMSKYINICRYMAA